MISMSDPKERICIHGVGHPEPDAEGVEAVHSCDGCCWSEVS